MVRAVRNVEKVAVVEKVFFEIFVVNQEIEEMIYNNVSIVELRKKSQGRWACVRCERMALEKFWLELPLWRRF